MDSGFQAVGCVVMAMWVRQVLAVLVALPGGGGGWPRVGGGGGWPRAGGGGGWPSGLVDGPEPVVDGPEPGAEEDGAEECSSGSSESAARILQRQANGDAEVDRARELARAAEEAEESAELKRRHEAEAEQRAVRRRQQEERQSR